MSAKGVTVESFLADVANHKLTVRMDNGCYRHLVFRQPINTWNMWFEIVTWPNMLTIHGDMGTWSFSRVEDMFTFFRSDQLRINASYWSEKIESESRFGGPHKTFIPEIFKGNVLSSLDGYGLSGRQIVEIAELLRDQVFCEEEESSARRALAAFKHEEFRFSDSWEIDGKGYTYHYLWCLHAIVWAIQQYDAVSTLGERPESAEVKTRSRVANALPKRDGLGNTEEMEVPLNEPS
jgi:hypothetical protein